MSSKQEDIARLIELMGVDAEDSVETRMELLWNEAFLKALPKEKIGAAEAERIKFMQSANAAARLMKGHVKAYDSRFSHEEIKEMLAFYEGATARKFVEVAADIARDVLNSLSDVTSRLGSELTDHLQAAGVIPADTKAEAAKNRIMASVLKRMSN